MFNFFYHIPSAMTDSKWNQLQYPYNNEFYAASAAIQRHYRGTESPVQLEIWIKRKAKTNSTKVKVRRFQATQNGKWSYDVVKLQNTDLHEMIDKLEGENAQ